MKFAKLTALAALAAVLQFPAHAQKTGDWPMWGGDMHRNMHSDAAGIPTQFTPGDLDADEKAIMDTTQNIKWVAKLGSQAYGNPVVAGGKVLVGTNNETPRDPRHIGDRGNVYCLDEKTGEFIWQLVVPKLGAGKVSDWEYLGICSSSAIDGSKAYVVTNRCEVVCMDMNGLADGNQGMTDEATYMSEDGTPIEPSPTDADILWIYDMRDELGVFPHNIASNSPVVVGDRVYVATSNGVDWSHTNIPSPNAPVLIALDKNTGELLGEEASGIGSRMLHCNWSSPAFGTFDGQEQILFGGGDGFAYGFDPKTKKDDNGFDVFPELWRLDLNPHSYRFDENGNPIKYATYPGPSEVISSPVIYNDHVYVVTGQDPEHGEGVGSFNCIDPTKRGDLAETGLVWRNTEIGRSISTPAIADGLVFAADYAGELFCFDAANGELYWKFNTESHIWSSPLTVDGHVYLGNEDGSLFILEIAKEMKLVNEIEFPAPIYSTPIVANGTMFVGTQTHLYAIGTPRSGGAMSIAH